MQKVLAVAFKAAPSDATVLILGESGTGKCQLARAIHKRSGRAAGPFVTFRHATDAWEKTVAAEGGILFFDEICELDPTIQAKLLHLLQEQDEERTRENNSPRSKVRVIAATNHDIRQAVEKRFFREDLYYRLNVISLDLPPLRHRTEDLERIVNALLTIFAMQADRPVKRLSPASWKKLRLYSWPGNIPELEDVLKLAVTRSEGDEIHLPNFAEPPRLQSPVGSGLPCTLEEIGNEHIRQVLAKTDSIKDAAIILGIDPATLHRKLKKLRDSRPSRASYTIPKHKAR
jgi:NtrC-family two-component system response regulator AlgB